MWVSVSPFEYLIGKLDSENVEYFVMGDLNCNMTSTRYDDNTLKLMSIADVYHVTSATHLRTDKLKKLPELGCHRSYSSMTLPWVLHTREFWRKINNSDKNIHGVILVQASGIVFDEM